MRKLLEHLSEQIGSESFAEILDELKNESTDVLAHKLDVPYEFAKLIQTKLASITAEELKSAEDAYKRRTGGR